MVCLGGIFLTTKATSLYEVLSPRSLWYKFCDAIKLVTEVQSLTTSSLLL